MMAELPWTSTIQVNSLFDLLDEGLVVLDNSGTIVHSNQAFADCLQYAAGDLVDRQFEDLVVEEQKGALAVHLSDDRGQPLSLSIVTREGDQKHVSVRSLGLTEQEEVKGFCLVITSHSDHCSDFERIVSSAYLKMVTVDTDFNITYANPAFREDPSEMLGTPVTDGVAPQYREKFREKLEASMKSETNQEFEFSEKRGDKPATWHVLRIAPIKEDEQIIGAVIAGYDITERVNAMLALQASEEKFRGVFEHANDGITLADEQGKIVEINEAQENLSGIKREDVIGMPLWELQASMLAEGEKTPETRKYLEDSVSSFFETGTAPWLERKTEGEFIHPLDGSQRFFEQTAFKIPTSKGAMLGSFVWDITEKKATEAALKTIEKRHEQALMGADLGVWEWIRDPKTGAETWHVNKRFADIMGYTVDEIKSHFLDWSTIIHPEDYPMVHNHWERHEAKELAHYSVEYRLRTKDGGWKWILDRGMIVEWDEKGSATLSSGTFLDITDRKETQAALDEVRERYELALRGADLGVWDWNAEDDEMVFSDRWAEILGYKVDDIESNYLGWEKLIHPDDLDAMVSKWDAHVDGKTDFYSNEHRMLTKTGEWKWILERGKVVEWKDDGGTKRATGTLLDITERKMIEKELRQSEERYRNLLENIPQKVFYKDRDSVYVAANPAYAADLGITPDDIVGKTDYDFFPKELAEYFVSTDQEVLESLKPFENDESQFLEEETRYSQIVKAPVRDDEGNVVGILGIFWDTTDSTRAAEALRESETKYRSLVEQSVMGLTILPEGLDNIVFANSTIGDILGYTTDDLLELNNEQINALIHPDDVDTLVQYLNRLLHTTETGESIQIRMIHKDGSQVWTEVSAGGIEFENVTAVQLSVVDITERLKAEEALKESELKFRRVFESMPVSMYLLRLDDDEEFTLVDANPASDKLFNLEHSKYLGKKISEIRMPLRANEIPVRLKEVVTTGTPWVFDQVVYDGDDIKMAMQVQVFRTSTDTVVNSFLDITERMIQDLEIKRLNEGLSRIVDERTAELAAANKELEAFAYSVSHDLRAPLRTIDGFSQALLEDYSESIDDTGRDFLKRVRSAATHMGSLIEDLLVLSRVTRAEMDRTEVDLSKVANEVVEGLREVEPERDVDISISDYTPARCDRRLVKLVVQNLIDNAWKFTSKITDAQIEFGSIEKDDETVFYVKDNGAGFNMDYIDKLFAPFQRLHPSEEFEGSGIGLATVQRIISRHGGRVWAESVIDEGSTFYFTIPE